MSTKYIPLVVQKTETKWELQNSLPIASKKNYFYSSEITKFYNAKKKKNPKHKSQVQLNVQPSLSWNRIDLLKKANEVIEGNENFKFAYADMHGNLKFVLNKLINRKYVKHFRSEDDIINIISAYCEEDEF